MKANKQGRIIAATAAVVGVSAMTLFVSSLGNDGSESVSADSTDYVSESISEDTEGITDGIYSVSKVESNLVGSTDDSSKENSSENEKNSEKESESADTEKMEMGTEERVAQILGEIIQSLCVNAENAIPYEYEDTFIVNVNDYINVREQASAESALVGKIYKGGGGTVVEKGSEWSKIISGNVEGYIKNEYAFFAEEAEAHMPEFCSRYGVSNANALRVRKGPSTDDEIIAVVNTGTEVQVISIDGEWAKVNYIGQEAYIFAEYLEIEYYIEIGITIEEEQEAIRLEQERLAAEQKAAEEAEAARKQQIADAIANSQLTETVQTSAYSVSEEDAYLLACLVCSEAGYESYEGKLAVANVVLNRLSGGYYGSTIYDVVYSKGQFTVVTNGALNRVIKNGPNAESLQAAKDALSGTNNVPNYANFCSLRVADFSRYEEYSIICNQVFYRRK